MRTRTMRRKLADRSVDHSDQLRPTSALPQPHSPAHAGRTAFKLKLSGTTHSGSGGGSGGSGGVHMPHLSFKRAARVPRAQKEKAGARVETPRVHTPRPLKDDETRAAQSSMAKVVVLAAAARAGHPAAARGACPPACARQPSGFGVEGGRAAWAPQCRRRASLKRRQSRRFHRLCTVRHAALVTPLRQLLSLAVRLPNTYAAAGVPCPPPAANSAVALRHEIVGAVEARGCASNPLALWRNAESRALVASHP